ncbi:MAG: homocitrate synthase/isopropylmalate synthase family protein [Promethearchaeota archaeon]
MTRLDESPFKNYDKNDFKKLLINFNTQLMEENFPNRSKKVKVWDESLRDGEQSPGVFLKTDEKIEIAKLLDDIGVNIIAAGFPAVSKQELEMVKRIASEGFKNANIAAVSRMKKEDINAVIETDCDEIIFFVPLSDLFLKLVLRKEIEDIHEMLTSALEYAKDHGLNPSVVAEDASRTSIETIIEFFRRSIDNGASKIVYADTVGVLFPETTHFIIKRILDELKKTHANKFELGIHVHDDYGLATANTIAGVLEGVTYPHVCINGYGERAGNAPLEEVTVALEMNGIDTNLKLDKISHLSKVAEEYFGIPITSHKAIVGRYSFSHESGIHVAAVLMHPLTYEPIPPKKVGRKRQFYLGKFSGTKSIAEKLANVGMEFPREILQEIVQKVKEKQERRDKTGRKEVFKNIMKELEEMRMGVTDNEFWDIVRGVIRKHEQYQEKVNKIPENNYNPKTR